MDKRINREQLMKNLREIDMLLFILEFKVGEKTGKILDNELSIIEQKLDSSFKNLDCIDGAELKKVKTDLNLYRAKCNAVKEQMRK